MGIERMQVDHRHAGGAGRGPAVDIGEPCGLNATATIAFNAVASAGHDQPVVGRAIAIDQDVQRECLTVATGFRVGMAIDLESDPLRGCGEALPCLCIAGRKRIQTGGVRDRGGGICWAGNARAVGQGGLRLMRSWGRSGRQALGGAGRSSAAEAREPNTSPQNGAPMPAIGTPATVTTKVTSAPSGY